MSWADLALMRNGELTKRVVSSEMQDNCWERSLHSRYSRLQEVGVGYSQSILK